MKIKHKKSIIRFTSTAIAAMLLMWLTPRGSFSPKEIGFYTSIIIALVVDFVMHKFVYKYPKKWDE